MSDWQSRLAASQLTWYPKNDNARISDWRKIDYLCGFIYAICNQWTLTSIDSLTSTFIIVPSLCRNKLSFLLVVVLIWDFASCESLWTVVLTISRWSIIVSLNTHKTELHCQMKDIRKFMMANFDRSKFLLVEIKSSNVNQPLRVSWSEFYRNINMILL